MIYPLSRRIIKKQEAYQYYNGWEHDLPEPDWEQLATKLILSPVIGRDTYGNYYITHGATNATISKYDIFLNLVSTISGVSESSRSFPFIIPNFDNSNRDVMVFGGYTNTGAIINLDDFTLNTKWNTTANTVIFPAGHFTDKNNVQNSFIFERERINYRNHRALMFYEKGKSVISLYATGGSGVLTDNNFIEVLGGEFLLNIFSTLNPSNPYACSYGCASDKYFVLAMPNAFGNINKFAVFDINIFMENYNFQDALQYQFQNNDNEFTNGLNCLYIYNDKLVAIDFFGKTKIYDLMKNGTVISNIIIGGNNRGHYYWRNKVFDTNTKLITILPI